jgi:ribosome-associated protein
MNIVQLQRTVVDALADKKGQDIVVFDTTGLTSLWDRVVIATGSSNRNTRALADHVREKVKAEFGLGGRMEGEQTGEWVLLDFEDLVVHVMQPAIRTYYNLEGIWGGTPVDVAAEWARFQRSGEVPRSGRDQRQAAAGDAARRRAAAAKKPRAAGKAAPAPVSDAPMDAVELASGRPEGEQMPQARLPAGEAAAAKKVAAAPAKKSAADPAKRPAPAKQAAAAAVKRAAPTKKVAAAPAARRPAPAKKAPAAPAKRPAPAKKAAAAKRAAPAKKVAAAPAARRPAPAKKAPVAAAKRRTPTQRGEGS